MERKAATQHLSALLRGQRMFVFLLILSVSYWYCLPVVTQSIVGYNEFRGYDFLLFALMVTLIRRHKTRLQAFFQKDEAGQRIFQFCKWASATSFITGAMALIEGRAIWAMVTAIFLFHLWGFVLLYAAIRIFIRTRRECLILLDIFLAIGVIEALLISPQGMGVVPRFWSDLYNVYGDMAFSGTLGPNRTMPGHVMVLVFAVASSYWRNISVVGVRRICLASAAAVLSLIALGMTGSRTAWTTFLVFAAVSFLGKRPPLGMLIFIVIIALSIIAVIPDSVVNRISEIYSWRVTSGLERGADKDYLGQFQEIDAGRYELWTEGLTDLVQHPWLIPFGGGFNNYSFLAEGSSAHNQYITLIIEVGVVGLYLYLMWLKGIWRGASRLIDRATKIKRPGREVFLPVEIKTLLVALMISLVGGEILYPYRPTFTFMGMFLFLCAVMGHRALVCGDANRLRKRVSARKRASAQMLKSRRPKGLLLIESSVAGSRANR